MKRAIWIILALFIIPLQANRLLVNIEPTASFTPEEFAQAASAKLISTDLRNPHKAFQDIYMDNAFVVVSPSLQESQIRSLSLQYGYRYVTLGNTSLVNSIEQVQHLLNINPKSSNEIPKLSLEESIRVYQLMEKIDRVFTANQLRYWAGGGTLLGAVRHEGLIPWDNDLDLYILEMDEQKLISMKLEFQKEGLVVHHHWKDIYKIYELDAPVIYDEKNPGDILPYRNPSADIFIMALERRNEVHDVYVHRSHDFYWHWNNDRFEYSQLESITRVPFGPISIPIPGNPESYLNRVYGTSWKKYAMEPFWNHKLEARASYSGSSLVEINDFAPAPWQ